ncbi:unnamed protein product [Musa acuminata subsp. burmannicoides]
MLRNSKAELWDRSPNICSSSSSKQQGLLHAKNMKNCELYQN